MLVARRDSLKVGLLHGMQRLEGLHRDLAALTESVTATKGALAELDSLLAALAEERTGNDQEEVSAEPRD
ncbi:MAG: hypothetical protein WC700_14570 [Gemmatimonadaceae bacterium]